MAMSLISSAHHRLGDKEIYFMKLLQETLRVYVAMMTYGNRTIQERMISIYKEALRHFGQAQ